MKAGFSTGGEAMNITELAYPEIKRVAERVSSVAPGRDLILVNILAHDHAEEPTADNSIIVEASKEVDLGGHLYLFYGAPKNVFQIAAACCRKMATLPLLGKEALFHPSYRMRRRR